MAGYSPASTLISNLPQATAVYFDKEFIKNLKANTPFLRCTQRRELPMNSGNALRMYKYNVLSGNTQQSSEGVVGSGITPTVATNLSVIGQYSDYINVSDIALDVAIDPALENLQKEVAYRLALTLSQLVRTTADASNAIDGNVAGAAKGAAVTTRTDLTTAVQSLQGRDVKPFDQGSNRYVGIIHPFTVGDVVNDTANNSLLDIYKHTEQGLDRLLELPGEDNVVPILDFGGLRFYESSIVTSTANFNASNTAYRTYIFGEEAVISISLGSKEGAMVGDGDWNNLQVWMNRYDKPSQSDPARLIGGSVAYNTRFVSTLPCDTVMRMRYIDAVSGIS